MAKVLMITKPDSTIHVVPLAIKNFWDAHNNRSKPQDRVKMEVIDEKEVEDLPTHDPNYLNPTEAVEAVDTLKKENAEKDAEIEKLRKQLAQQANPPIAKAEDVITKINWATTVETIEDLVKGDERKTVKDAADKKIAALKA